MTHPEVLRLIDQLRLELAGMIWPPEPDGRQITALDVVSPAFAEFDQPGNIWPDSWHTWNIAREDAYTGLRYRRG